MDNDPWLIIGDLDELSNPDEKCSEIKVTLLIC